MNNERGLQEAFANFLLFLYLEESTDTKAEESKHLSEGGCINIEEPSTEVDELSKLLGAVSLQTPLKSQSPDASACNVNNAQTTALTDQIEKKTESVSGDNETLAETKLESPTKETSFVDAVSDPEVEAANEAVKDETSDNIDVTNTDNSTLEPRSDDANLTEDSEIEFNIPTKNPVSDKTTAPTNSPGGVNGSPKEEDNSKVVPVATDDPNLSKESIEDKGKEEAEVPVNEISQGVLSNESNTEVKTPEQEEPVRLESSKVAPEPQQSPESVKPNQEETAENFPVSTFDQVQSPIGDVLNTDINTGSDAQGGEELPKSGSLETEASETASASLKPTPEEEKQVQSESLPATECELTPEPGSPPLVPKGSYNIDFDAIDLENFNPFGTKSKVDNDAVLPGPSAVQPSPEKTLVGEGSPLKATPKKSPKKASPKKASPEKNEKLIPTAIEKDHSEQVATAVPEVKQDDPEIVANAEDQLPPKPESPSLVPKGSYNIDFDSIDLENFNPFGTKSKVVNDTPLPGASTDQTELEPNKESPKKVTPKKTPKKISPKKTSPKKALPKKEVEEDEIDDSFHDAVEEVSLSETKALEVRNAPPYNSLNVPVLLLTTCKD